MEPFDFDSLFIFEMANNHQGDPVHAQRIVRAMGELARRHRIRAGLKLQFRQLDSFIHPDFRERSDLPHIPRFLETRLSQGHFNSVIEETRARGLVPIATAFDEESVDVMLDLGIEVVKVGSCSAMDRPLLDKVASTGRPIIVSVGGLNLQQVDHLVSLLESRNAHFALMHCVAIYPTPLDKLRLNQIAILKNRYPTVPIGYSTHEDPNLTSPIQIAYGKGARLFERHVGVQAGGHTLNAYSSSVEQLDPWIEAYKTATQMCGGESERPPAFPEETVALDSLKRGVWSRRPVEPGEHIRREDVFFAMPLQEGQMNSDAWNDDGFTADREYEARAPLPAEVAPCKLDEDEDTIFRIMLQVSGLLREAKIALPRETSIEISHHFGLRRFREYGAVIIDVINREYCKKLIIQLPRQKHPYHYHKKKEETFQLLHGDLEILLEGQSHRLGRGETCLVKPAQWHKFQTLKGMVVEEISTHHEDDDSFYDDEHVRQLPRERRKTNVPDWIKERVIP